MKETGEEIITRDYPTKRYGVGVLYPFATSEEDNEETKKLEEASTKQAEMLAENDIFLPEQEADNTNREKILKR